MAITTKEQLKSYFETGDYPTEENFRDLIDTMLTREDLEELDPGVDTELSETSINPIANATVTAELKKKVNAVEGMGLSSNDFTDGDKEKLDGLQNYDDSALKAEIAKKVSNTDLATINGQRIDEGGNIEIEVEQNVTGAVLYTEQSLTEEQKSQARTNIGVDDAIESAIAELPEPESSVFKAVFGKTSFAEIQEAYGNGKVIHCDYKTQCYVLSRILETAAYFDALSAPNSYRITCSSNGWTETIYQLEVKTNRVTTISKESTDEQYPSAKAVYDALQNIGGDTWNVLELNTADIPEDRILLDVGADKYITDVDIDLAFSTNTPLTEEKEFRLGFLNTTGSGYGNVIRQNLNLNNALSVLAKYIGECVSVNNVKVSRMRSGWCGLSTNKINEQGVGGGWTVAYATGSMYVSISEVQNRRYLQIYNYFSKDTLVFAWVRIKYKTANV